MQWLLGISQYLCRFLVPGWLLQQRHYRTTTDMAANVMEQSLLARNKLFGIPVSQNNFKQPAIAAKQGKLLL